ncbi:MAG: homocysteine biosynthesis protein [Nitrososphaerota archaeon]|uniref:homocysteine biosynthesis protein n=1 Tax=Candidatus Bathycorpusculum sp. TaxID=2994959 RepID=UPI0028246C60|nr:homocysteine biosynthesis protein [Candidatus Termitimicrobium sp.]MCL2432567.1 homocysteine biosynthesis protein [Candidatus Termitimicrobium sp.]MDR0493033.1 homocysteine biosynthesis protein [Nitrososphaerota archaeon]
MSKQGKTRTVEEINQKILKGDAQVLTAQEMKKLVESSGVEVAFKEVDVVTTGTFGAMCSSGAVINIGHSDPPIKIDHAWLNGVEVCHPGAAVDLFIGATNMSEKDRCEYGGGHVIEDLVAGKEVELRATAYGTDCYPRTALKTILTKDDLNQFQLLNFRNCYQRYNCAVNSSDEIIYTYMSKLLPHFRNATFSGAGELNPLMNDPDYETMGMGTRIFLGGGQGYIIGEGTQHSPKNQFGNLMVKGDAKKMSPEFLQGASFTKYGTSMYVGLGVPIPILNKGLAQKTAIRDNEIFTDIIDYSVPQRDRPNFGKVSYKELKSGSITINDKKVRVSSLSSLKMAKKVAETLKTWINESTFTLTSPVERLPTNTVCKPMRQTEEIPFVANVMHPAVTCTEKEKIRAIAERIVTKAVNHIVVVDNNGKLRGIVTSWDITRAMAEGKKVLADIESRNVITAKPNEPLEIASKRMAQHNISALPVVDIEHRVVGIVTSEDVSKLLGR